MQYLTIIIGLQGSGDIKPRGRP